MTTNKTQRVVIVGAGFAGINTYQTLRRILHNSGRIDITIINPNNYFGFTPLIHEVATGGMLLHSISQPLHALPRCCIYNFILGTAIEVDCSQQIVYVLRKGKPEEPNIPEHNTIEIPYDYLVLAMGSQTNFFNIPGAKKYALELNDVKNAAVLKNHILERFEHIQTLRDSKKQYNELSFIIVGGGPTGVELSGELSDFVNYIANRFFPKLAPYIQIFLLERDNQLLKKNIGQWFSKKATDILKKKKGVHILYKTSAEEVTEEGVQTNKGFVYGKTVIWTAGVIARTITFTKKHNVRYEKYSKRIRVNEFLQIPDHPNIFVLGDQAWVCDSEKNEPYPMRAQFAVQEGKLSAKNIVHMMDNSPLQSFRFQEKGMIISLGKGGALARIFETRFSGPLAWFIYRTVYLFSMIGWKTRLRVLFEWTFRLFSPRDISKL